MQQQTKIFPLHASAWSVSSDQVMGGCSHWYVTNDEETLVWNGVLSTENNGGFLATSFEPTVLWQEWRGIEVNWESNSSNLELIVYPYNRNIREFYRTQLSQRTQRIGWKDFAYSYRSKLNSKQKLNPTNIAQIGFLCRQYNAQNIIFQLKRLALFR